ncbi:MAG: hypothetical protein GDA40_12110 [Rhodobacteraceae bacterium]|nr:hypothetical protein [Paracoccaceae bacterium]
MSRHSRTAAMVAPTARGSSGEERTGIDRQVSRSSASENHSGAAGGVSMMQKVELCPGRIQCGPRRVGGGITVEHGRGFQLRGFPTIP